MNDDLPKKSGQNFKTTKSSINFEKKTAFTAFSFIN